MSSSLQPERIPGQFIPHFLVPTYSFTHNSTAPRLVLAPSDVCKKKQDIPSGPGWGMSLPPTVKSVQGLPPNITSRTVARTVISSSSQQRHYVPPAMLCRAETGLTDISPSLFSLASLSSLFLSFPQYDFCDRRCYTAP